MAGHTNYGTHLIDTHDGPVIDAVWELYRLADKTTEGASTLLEWDGKIPDFPTLHAEVLKARAHINVQSKESLKAVMPEVSEVGTAAISNPIHFMIPDAQ